MRRINSLEDAQKAINELLDWQSIRSSKDWDFRGLRISNASDGVNPQDYATVAQLPIIVDSTNPETDLDYAIVWDKEGTPDTGDIIPAYPVGKGREGIPHQILLTARVEGDFATTIYVKQAGQSAVAVGSAAYHSGVITSSNFSLPLPTIGYLHQVYPVLTNVSGAASITIALVVRRFRSRG